MNGKYFFTRQFIVCLLPIAVLINLTRCYTAEEKRNNEGESEKSKADSIIDMAIEHAGGDRFLSLHVEFDFRGRHYVGKRNNGVYRYERIFTDSLGTYSDILTNEGFVRMLNGSEIEVIDTMAAKYTRSVNSVLYFGLLPYGLNDPAVHKRFLGESSVKDKEYFNIEVTFRKEGGGDDYEDVFVYWINKKNYKVDYFGYTYVTDGGGVRFREARNPRVVNGVLFQDYINYKPIDGEVTPLVQYDSLFENGLLDELSTIELENVEVRKWEGQY